jgi:hypothetical protein
VKKVGVVKIIRSKPKSGVKGISERELALARPLGMTNKFAFSEPSDPALIQYDARALASHVPDGPVAKVLVGDSTPNVRKFSSLGESLPKLCGPSPAERIDAEAMPLQSTTAITGYCFITETLLIYLF